MNISRQVAISLCSAVLATGCGGGGGSNNDTSIPTAAVQINSSNASTVASGATSSSSTMGGVAQTTSLPTGVVSTTQQSTLNVINSAKNQIEMIKGLPLQPETVVGAAVALTSCSTGSGTFNWNDADNSQDYSFGDTISVVYSNCTDSTDGVLRNGSASFTIDTSSFTIQYASFSEAYGGNTLSMNGDLTFSTGTVPSGTYAGYTYLMVSGTSIETNSTVDGHFKMWAPTGGTNGYNVTFAFSGNNFAFGMDLSIASIEMNGSVSITTPTEFAGVLPNDPTSGQMIVEGDTGTGGVGNSKLRMTAQANGTDVLLEVDADGDGAYEWSQTTTWANL